MFNLGLMYDNGKGVQQSDTEAFKWFLAAADKVSIVHALESAL